MVNSDFLIRRQEWGTDRQLRKRGEGRNKISRKGLKRRDYYQRRKTSGAKSAWSRRREKNCVLDGESGGDGKILILGGEWRR